MTGSRPILLLDGETRAALAVVRSLGRAGLAVATASDEPRPLAGASRCSQSRLLFLARKAGYKIVEIPINWTNIPGSKVNLVKDSLSMFFDIMRFRFRDLAGQYRNPADESIFEPASVEEAAR